MNRNPVTCHNCGRPGHVANRCYQRRTNQRLNNRDTKRGPPLHPSQFWVEVEKISDPDRLTSTLSSPKFRFIFSKKLKDPREEDVDRILAVYSSIAASTMGVFAERKSLIDLLFESKFDLTLTVRLQDPASSMANKMVLMKKLVSVLLPLVRENPSHADLFSPLAARMQHVSSTVPDADMSLITDAARKDLEAVLAYFSRERVQESTVQQKTPKIPSSEKLQMEPEPPESFRQLPSIPSKEELLTTEAPFLRQNKVGTSYDNDDHYLDVQFRLLKEDFVNPLRRGIREFLDCIGAGADPRSSRFQFVRHYVGHITQALPSSHGIVHEVYLSHPNPAAAKRQNFWVKRLIFGSLLVLSSDNFNTILLASVIDRPINALERGFFKIRIESSTDRLRLFKPELGYDILETSSAYFGAYRPVLDTLKATHGVPLSQYIVQGSTESVIPHYLRGKSYKFDSILDRTNFRSRKKVFAASALAPWPHESELGLDDSQYPAFKAALTSEISIIQGPPGCGKTYLGLKVARVLLENKLYVLPEEKDSPLLVICYTNHALDQFLEGIHDFITREKLKVQMVRLGGRSKNPVMDKLSLRELKNRNKNRAQTNASRMRGRAYRDMKTTEEIIETNRQNSSKSLLSMDEIIPLASENTYLTLLEYVSNFESEDIGLMEFLGVIPRNVGLKRVPDADEPSADLAQGLESLLINEDGMEEEGEQTSTEEGDGEDSGDGQEEPEDLDGAEVEDEAAAAEELRRDEDLTITEARQPKQAKQDGLQCLEALEDGSDGFKTNINKKKVHARLIKMIYTVNPMEEAQESAIVNVADLDIRARQALYKLWFNKNIQMIEEEQLKLIQEFEDAAEQHSKAAVQENIELLSEVGVLGMTSTAAAKNQDLLKSLKPKVVIIEEAAECLEAHIVASLTRSCQHLILIGDHKQLKPSIATYALSTDFNFDISLFERMVTNGYNCHTLAYQHRMKPDIAAPLKHIYPRLQNHEVVLSYPDVKGVTQNVYYFNHALPEDKKEGELQSKSNLGEAKLIVQFVRFLRQQGYGPGQITILTPYTGQLTLFRNLTANQAGWFRDLAVKTVDNFQGEENDIIILSLVRSSEKSIGFIKEENRICVAISRAKIGFYAFGNFTQYAAKVDLWRNIVETMTLNDQCGKEITLGCQKHPKYQVKFTVGVDLSRDAPEGGCLEKCGARMPCGHSCRLMCHSYDPEHEKVTCAQPCARKCKNGHGCGRTCSQKCPPCRVKVSVVLPSCGHKAEIECFKDPEKHLCNIPFVVKGDCGHNIQVACHQEQAGVTPPCRRQCQQVMECGDLCGGDCGRCSYGRLHVGCTNRCKRVHLCGHTCSSTCSKQCPPCTQLCQTRCPHNECRKLCCEPCAPCAEPCTVKCRHRKCSKLCGEPCDITPCAKPCKKKLRRCKHACAGLCGEDCPPCKICFQHEVTSIFFGTEEEPSARFIVLKDCKHVFEVTGLDAWVNMSSSEESVAVQTKLCPRCKTPIIRTKRYWMQTRQALADIEQVKRKIPNVLLSKDDKSSDSLSELVGEAVMELDYKWKLHILESLAKRMKQVTKVIGEETAGEIHKFIRWITRNSSHVATEEIVNDVELEMLRLMILARVEDADENRVKIGEEDLHRLRFSRVEKSELEEFYKKVSGPFYQEVTREELEKVREAMGGGGAGTANHWYKCPKGHLYFIGDCGGPNEGGKCPECKETIGGQGYQLAAGNQAATEMSDAPAAFTNEANLAIGPNVLYHD